MDLSRAVGIDCGAGDERRKARGLRLVKAGRSMLLGRRAWDAQPGSGPGRDAASTSNGWSGAPFDDEIDHPRARWVDPVQVVDDDARAARCRERGDRRSRTATSTSVAATSAGSSGMSADSASQPENAASRAIGRDRPAVPPSTSTSSRSSRNRSCRARRARVDAVLVGDGLREQPRPAVRLAAAYETFSVHVQAKPRSRAMPFDRLQQARLADAGVADDDESRRHGRSADPFEHRARSRRARWSGRRADPARRPGTGSRPDARLAAQRVQLDRGRLAAQHDGAPRIGRQAAARGSQRWRRRAGSRRPAPSIGSGLRS